MPPILKSCVSLPLFVTVNVTTPLATLLFESVKWNSDGVPAATATPVACDAAPAGSASASEAPTSAPTRVMLRTMVLLGSRCCGAYPTMPARRLSACRERPIRPRPRAPASAGSEARRLRPRGRSTRSSTPGSSPHLGFVDDGQPYVIPTLHARIGDQSTSTAPSASRRSASSPKGIPVCVTVTLVDGIVLARSVFEHSMNYRSVVVLGTATAVESEPEKNEALRGIHREAAPGPLGRRASPTSAELRRRACFDFRSTKRRRRFATGGPEDGDTPDAELDVWAGHIPLVVSALDPVPDPTLRAGIEPPDYVLNYRRQGFTR